MSVIGQRKPPYNAQGKRQACDQIRLACRKLQVLLSEMPRSFPRALALMALNRIQDSVYFVERCEVAHEGQKGT